MSTYTEISRLIAARGKIRDKLCSYDEYLAWRAEQNAQA